MVHWSARHLSPHPTMLRTPAFLGALAAGLTLTACSQFTEACTQELRVELAPRDTSVKTGATFPVAARLSSCGGKQQLHDTFTFLSTNPAVVSVDGATQRATAVGSGTAEISVTGRQYGQVGSIRVIVGP